MCCTVAAVKANAKKKERNNMLIIKNVIVQIESKTMEPG